MLKIYVAFLMCLLFAGCVNNDPKGTLYTKDQLGSQWPFTVGEVDVYCDGYKNVFLDAEGVTYAVNGKAKNEMIKRKDIHDLEEIWKDDPNLPGAKIGLPDNFIPEALKKCNNK